MSAGDGLLSGSPEGVSPGWLALKLVKAFTAEEADDAMRTQAVRCLVFLAPRLSTASSSISPASADGRQLAESAAPAADGDEGEQTDADDGSEDEDAMDSDHEADVPPQGAGAAQLTGAAIPLQCTALQACFL